MFKRLRDEIAAIKARDPAAHSAMAIFFCYPGFHAIVSYRLAHWMWRRGWQVPAIWLSYMARIVTGIEIHPGSTIGRRFFIDHGTGVVIGETAEIGDDVMLYQGVTLGGTSLTPGKRHPTLRDGVIVGAGAKVLGPLVIGENARIGSNAVVLKDVVAGATMVGIPAQPTGKADASGDAPRFVAYGTPCDGEPDPVACALANLREEVARLQARVAELEASGGGADATVRTVVVPAAPPIVDGPTTAHADAGDRLDRVSG